MMKRLIQLSIIAGVLFMPVSCSPVSRGSDKTDLTGKGDIYSILYYASLAGSSHNSQPWKTEVCGEDSILVYADMSRALPVVDKTHRELYISVGAFIENLSVAANCYGYRAVIRLYDTGSDTSKPVACVKLLRSAIRADDISLADIEQRTTLRIPFDTVPVRREDWKRLTGTDDSCFRFFSPVSPEGMLLAKKEYEAYVKQSRDEQASDELAGWIRFSDKDAKKKRDGITTAGMGINGIGGLIVRTFFSPEDSKKESFVTSGIEKTKGLVENCGGWMVITMVNDDVVDWVMTGRLYERVNLGCRKMGIGFHPMNQVIEEDAFEILLNSDLNLKGKIMFVARVGYVNKYPEPVSLRRPVESFCIFR